MRRTLGLWIVALVGCTSSDSAVPDSSTDTDASVGVDAADPHAPLVVGLLGSSTANGKNLDQPMYGGRVGGLVDRYFQRYLDHLSETRPGTTGIDLSKPGYGLFHALPTGTVNPTGQPAVDPAYNIDAVLAGHPDLLIIHYPSANGATTQQVIDNLVTITTVADAAGVPTWIATPHPTAGALDADIAAALARKAEIEARFTDHVLDFWTPLADANNDALAGMMLTDDVHPSAAGHQKMFDVLVAAGLPDQP